MCHGEQAQAGMHAPPVGRAETAAGAHIGPRLRAVLSREGRWSTSLGRPWKSFRRGELRIQNERGESSSGSSGAGQLEPRTGVSGRFRPTFRGGRGGRGFAPGGCGAPVGFPGAAVLLLGGAELQSRGPPPHTWWILCWEGPCVPGEGQG